jgi:hypothetical protein
MILLGSLLGVTAEWWGVIFGIAGIIVSLFQIRRKRREKKAESRKP